MISILYRKNNGFYIFNEVWDNMIILDACRYDIFEEQYKERRMNGTLQKKISRGSHTTTFLIENFIKSNYDDILYITSNPYVDKLIRDKVFKIISVWKEGWSKKHHTVLPKTMYEYSVNAIINNPDKRLIIHFMQPHYPYIGYTIGRNASNNLKRSISGKPPKKKDSRKKNKRNTDLFSYYCLDLYTIIKRNTHFKLYKNNLKLALPYVEKLIDLLPGKTIVTADHGEAIGDIFHPLFPIRIYGHDKYLRIPILTQVPWLSINETEKNINRRTELKEKMMLSNKIKNLKMRDKL
ncbi:MAG: hypothetical protein ACFFEY_07015 [Candidatus Thorarchaeota archaeon]